MRTKLCAWLLLVGASVIAFSLVEAQTPKKSRVSRPTPAQVAKARADSSAAARADSVKRAMAIADSLRRVDSLSRAAEDSVKRFVWRKVTNNAFGVGERLVFDVSYGPITAGEATMAVTGYDSIAGRLCYRVEFSVNSLKSFDWIYEVRDRYLTFIDVEAIAPLKFEQHIREGTYKRDFIAEFDQVNHIARTTEGDFPIPEYVHDIMSAFYYARTLNYSSMKPGDQIILYNFYKDKSHELGVKFLGRQELEVLAGTFRTIVVEPLVKEGGLFKAEGRIVIWLTDDERKIPVRVNTKVIIGSIDTELRQYSGLIGPLKAQIK